jgi:L-aminopeptidase/D-esterase-like protein
VSAVRETSCAIGHDRIVDTPFGSVLDVDGIGVGHHRRVGRGWQTGTSVIVCRSGAVPGVDVRGGGPGTRETDALRPENLVQRVHAVCLTGGSAYGLAAADGVMAELEADGLGFPIGTGVVPVVPTAVIFDLGRGGRFANRPDADFGRRAARAALAGRTPSAWGSVGAGTGARSGGLQGGVGTASRRVALPGELFDDGIGTEVTVAAIAVVNSNGSAIDPSTGLPWEPSGLRLRRPSAAERRAAREAATLGRAPALNTTIGVIVTDAALDKAEASKVASVAHDGMARAIRPAHSMTDGDTVFTLATGTRRLPSHPHRIGALNPLLGAAAHVFAAACTHAVVAATPVGDVPSWSSLCPSAMIA